VLSVFFRLFECADKELRKVLSGHIIKDIKNLNRKHKNNRVNNSLQNFLLTMMEHYSSYPKAARKAHQILIELYRKRIWQDHKTVDAISKGAFTSDPKILLATINFFLNKPTTEGGDSDDEGRTNNNNLKYSSIREAYQHMKVSKQKRSKKRKLDRIVKQIKKQSKNGADKGDSDGEDDNSTNSSEWNCNLQAIELVHDPQTYTEKLFAILKRSGTSVSGGAGYQAVTFRVKLLLMNLISLFINIHNLILLNFYPFLQKYLQPKQQRILNFYIVGVLCF
jgi:protein SDA1